MQSFKILLVLGSLIAIINGKPSSGSVPRSECKECDCGIPNVYNKIVGGQETKVNQYPWMAMLLYNGMFFCGGSLINDQYILTASHCVFGKNSKYEEDESQVIERGISKIIQHPEFDYSTINNDVALLKLDKKVDMVGKLRPVCLPEENNQFVNYTAIVIGWGATSEGGSPSLVLQEVKVPIISNEYCRRLYDILDITDNMLCAAEDEGGKDSCQGDSGGPLHVQNEDASYLEVAGVVSFGLGCAQPLNPGVYARVNKFLSWIKENTADACYCGTI